VLDSGNEIPRTLSALTQPAILFAEPSWVVIPRRVRSPHYAVP